MRDRSILQIRIEIIVFGCCNYRFGWTNFIMSLFEQIKFNHRVEIISGIIRSEYKIILK